MRTFANYTIWLYFVGSIIAAFFGNKLENVFSWLIKNVAIAAILVNMSRWVIAAVVDLSTLATFALGALPLHALWNDAVFKNNVYYMKTYSNLNVNASTSQQADKYDFTMMYGCTKWEWANKDTRYYLPCAVNDRKLFYQWTTGEPLTRAQYKEDFINIWKSDTTIDVEKISDAYCVYEKQIIRNDYGTDISKCKELQRLMVDWKEEWINFCATVDEIVTKATNNSWPLQTIFASILNMSELAVTTNTWSIKEVSLNLLIKLVFWIALIVPLIALAVVMIVRVVYLWLIIVFSPLITIAVALQRGDKIGGKIEGVLSNVLKPTQIISLIFLPVIATFGLSISIIFLSLLKTLPLIESDVWRSEYAQAQPDGCYNDIGTALGMTRDETPEWVSYDLDITEVNFTKWLRETGADVWNMMSWLIINFFGIALMRMVVFGTLKTNEFTKWIAETIDKTAKDRMWTVPLPLMWWLWLTTLKKTPELLEQKLIWNQVQKQEQILDEFAQSYAPETKELKNTLTEGQKDPSKLGWLNEPVVANNTDFLSDYQMWGKAYAEKAKTYYYDAQTGKLTKAGEAYAKTNGRVDANGNADHTKAISEISSSLDGVKDRNTALANKDFVHWMHTENGGKGYDEFLQHRDTRTVKTNSTVQAIESWLKTISGDKNHGEHLVWNENTHRYLYDHDSKLTTFKRDKNNRNFIGKKPETFTIDNNVDVQKLTDEHLTIYNKMLAINKDRFADIEFFKKITTRINNKDEIEVNGKKYKAVKDENNQSVLKYELQTVQ